MNCEKLIALLLGWGFGLIIVSIISAMLSLFLQ